LKQRGLKVAIIRHPMPYGNLELQAMQRFTSTADLDNAECTVEEREEYEPHLLLGNNVYAGIDYAAVVSRAESEVDIILWDGGNNDFSFIHPDLNIVLVDPLRPGHETTHHPGEALLRTADIILVSKVNSASDADIQQVTENAHQINPAATIVRGASPVQLDDPEAVRGKRVLVVEDGPTITHGGMPYGAGYVAATEAQAEEIIDPHSYATEDIMNVYAAYPHIGAVLPAVGYHSSQLQALCETINAAEVDVVVSATPCDIAALIEINKPVIRARYEFTEAGDPSLARLLEEFLKQKDILE
jgi:predicted GTPase